MLAVARGGMLQCALGIVLLAASQGAPAQGLRGFDPIAAPDAAGRGAPAATRPVSRQRVAEALARVIAAWNAGRLGSVLARDFYAASRLDDAIQVKVPRDARLRILAIEGVQVLRQTRRRAGRAPGAGAAAERDEVVSEVSVTARTQIEFNDPDPPAGVGAFRRIAGRNEFLLRIREVLR